MFRSTPVWALALAGLVAVAIASCSTEVPGRSGSASAKASSGGEKALVNPASLFEPLPESQPGRVEQEATLLRRLISSPTILNPLFNSLWEDHYMHGLLYVYPVTRNIEMDQIFSPLVVQSWERSEDGLSYTLHLNPELRWHDGEPWTAYDIEFTYRTILGDRVPSLFYKLPASRLADVRALDAHTVRYEHKELLATQMKDMALPVIPQHIFDKPAERAEDPTLRTSEYFSHYGHREIIGSGPYRLVRWAANDQLVIERWQDSPLPPARFARQVLKILPDPNVSLLLFKKGELHEMALSSQQFATQTDDQGFRDRGVKATGPLRMVNSIGWNMDGTNPFFNDATVRRAMSHAFDSERFLRDSLYGLYQTSNGIFDRAHWAFNPEIERFTYDLEEAARLLDSAGWKVDADTGWRHKVIGGENVRFEFELMIGQGNPTWTKLVNLYSESLKRIGVKLEPRIFEVASLVARLKRNEFQSYIAVVEVTNDPDEWGNYWETTAITDGYNYVGYSNARVDELFEKARRVMERDKRRPLYQEIQGQIYRDQPFTFIWDSALMWAFDKRLRGITLAPSGPFLHYPGLRDWWLETAGPATAATAATGAP